MTLPLHVFSDLMGALLYRLPHAPTVSRYLRREAGLLGQFIAPGFEVVTVTQGRAVEVSYPDPDQEQFLPLLARLLTERGYHAEVVQHHRPGRDPRQVVLVSNGNVTF